MNKRNSRLTPHMSDSHPRLELRAHHHTCFKQAYGTQPVGYHKDLPLKESITAPQTLGDTGLLDAQ